MCVADFLYIPISVASYLYPYIYGMFLYPYICCLVIYIPLSEASN